MLVANETMQGETYATQYYSAKPFPHILLRKFWDEKMLREVAREVKSFDFFDGEKDFHGAKKKRYCGSYDKLPPNTRDFIDHCSTPEFLRFLEDMTGEQGLVADQYLEGGGIHSLKSGGFLKVHADFNWHSKLKLYRRLNLIVYLNEGWQKTWGGALELWNRELSDCPVQVFPELNNTVIFTTDDNSLHGHPNPMTCPEDVTRDSIALYYYSEQRQEDASREHRLSTDYHARGLKDMETMVAKGKEKLASLFSKSKS
jgi:Rps23 Pro-64 3,4-dihydroxylase Tpa1-like proline 4-hydroxylase